jgi:hypothetical protein
MMQNVDVGLPKHIQGIIRLTGNIGLKISVMIYLLSILRVKILCYAAVKGVKSRL